MKVLKVLAVLLAVGMFSTTAFAVDDCPKAVPAPGPVDPCLDTTPTGPLGSCTGGGGVKDVWVSFVAAATAHRVGTDIGSAGTDSDFIVYSSTTGAPGDCTGLTEIGCAEDISAAIWLSATCVGALIPGNTYYVRVGCWADGACGPYAVTIGAATGDTCGDGIISCVGAGYPGAEQCDDGNTVGGDCCSATCQFEVVCGNNCLEGTEECDDGNTVDGDGCSSGCLLEGVCGNGIIEPIVGEECDPPGGTTCPEGSYCNSGCRCLVGEGIPAVSEWGLAVLLLIGLVSGTILFGRRRQAVS